LSCSSKVGEKKRSVFGKAIARKECWYCSLGRPVCCDTTAYKPGLRDSDYMYFLIDIQSTVVRVRWQDMGQIGVSDAVIPFS
jgi:hypothetical protein